MRAGLVERPIGGGGLLEASEPFFHPALGTANHGGEVGIRPLGVLLREAVQGSAAGKPGGVHTGSSEAQVCWQSTAWEVEGERAVEGKPMERSGNLSLVDCLYQPLVPGGRKPGELESIRTLGLAETVPHFFSKFDTPHARRSRVLASSAYCNTTLNTWPRRSTISSMGRFMICSHVAVMCP